MDARKTLGGIDEDVGEVHRSPPGSPGRRNSRPVQPRLHLPPGARGLYSGQSFWPLSLSTTVMESTGQDWAACMMVSESSP